MSNSLDTGWGAHILDGVPFMIRHQPVTAPILPLHLQHDYYPEVLLDEYDFSLEEKLLAPPPPPPEPISVSSTQSSPIDQSPDGDTTPLPKPRVSVSEQPAIPIPVPRKAQLSHDILVPTKLESKSRTEVTASNSVKTLSLDPLTLKDFDKIDDPFESVELKTINERIELESLFSGGAASSAPASTHSQSREESPLPAAAAVIPRAETSRTPPVTSQPPPCVSQVTFPKLEPKAKSRSLQQIDTTRRVPPPLVHLPKVSNGNNGALTSPEFSSEDTQLIERLCSMGFPRDRVCRAVRAVAQDERTLVEHLCAVERLVEEQGLKSVEAEAALHLFFNNEHRALQYCKLRNELLTFGFTSDQISEALVMSDLNRDKALQLLRQQ